MIVVDRCLLPRRVDQILETDLVQGLVPRPPSAPFDIPGGTASCCWRFAARGSLFSRDLLAPPVARGRLSPLRAQPTTSAEARGERNLGSRNYEPRSSEDTVLHQVVVSYLETFLEEARTADGGSGD
jgi:hypothetical protein